MRVRKEKAGVCTETVALRLDCARQAAVVGSPPDSPRAPAESGLPLLEYDLREAQIVFVVNRRCGEEKWINSPWTTLLES